MASPGIICRYIIAICILFMTSSLFGQRQIFDSLKDQIKIITGSKKVDTINALSKHFYLTRQFAVSEKLSFLAIEEAGKINYTLGEGVAYTSLANTGYSTRNFVSAEKNSKNAIDIFNQQKNEAFLAMANTIWGQSVWAQSRFDEAINAFTAANQVFHKMLDSVNTGITYSLLALAEEERGNYEKALQYATKAVSYKDKRAFIALGQLYADVGDVETALDYYARANDTDLVDRYLKVGEAYFQKNSYDSARHFYQLYLNVAGDDNRKTLSKPYVLLGELYLATKQYDSALVYLRDALAGFKEVNDMNWVMRTLLESGKAFKEINQPQKAIEYTRELLRDATQTSARQYERDAHFLLYQLFGQLNKSDSAYTHLKTYTLLNNAIGIDISARKLALFKIINEREQAQLKIDLLSREKQLQQEEIRRASQQKTFLLIGVLILALLFVVLIRNILLKKKNAEHLRQIAENELNIQKLQSKKMLGELEMQVLRTQMNPHFIFNSLNSIDRFILQNNRADATAYLTKFSRLVRMILQNSKSSLITIEQELISLELYLELESLRFDGRFNYKIKIDQAIDLSMLKIPPLIIQPFVENAVWHGLMPKETTGNVEIELSQEDDFLLVRITDDGVGRIKPVSSQHHETNGHRSMGLNITSERINMLYTSGVHHNPVNIIDLVDTNGLPAGTQVNIILPVLYD